MTHSPLPISSIPEILGGIADDCRVTMFGDYFTSFTGAYFEPFAAMSDPFRFEASDLVAIEALSVTLHPHGAKTLLLDTVFADRCSALLREIPVNTPLHTVERSLIEEGSPAVQLWRLLRQLHGMQSGLTVISKLMAAKRPLLFPIWDTQVATVVAAPDNGFWGAMYDLVSDSDARTRIERVTGDAPDNVGLLRRIDVALWLLARRTAKAGSSGSSD